MNSNINTELESIINLAKMTTITRIIDNTDNVIYGVPALADDFVKVDRKPINLENLKTYWGKIIPNRQKWTKELQNYLFLNEAFSLFHSSCSQLRINKFNFLDKSRSEKSEDIEYYNHLSGSSLYGVYFHGKKCIDLLSEMNLIQIQKKEEDFFSKFKESRNKFFEHNYNPANFNFQIDPRIWSLIGTDNQMEIKIHISGESSYRAYIDYFEDYFTLEEKIVEVIKQEAIKITRTQ